ncbi:hypothetical protein CN360_02295 [Bacillus cereus]|uniref:Uncharacterized protein n=1 Tax=Bacillus thuringiensis TaxID=1428 RepID=A0A9X6KID4_BACTU|nr:MULTISPECIES: hypothetical protein [Bacillus cereus group]MBV6705951.1 hypothetical protein [Bacillus thuringiensis]MDA2612270.1 hypothetical protein [Bacillus cereus]MDR4440649.1 hypothetical protein [Bacillus cereus]MDR5050575.1 hypothetical protein [Bacillus thuringiensis]MEB8653007.1 hypothetical protein [Bacillus cereus]
MALTPHGYRIYGDKKLEDVISILDENLEIKIDGIVYNVILKTGEYKTYHEQFESEIPEMITTIFRDNNIPVFCKLGGVYDFSNNRTVLVFEHMDTKKHHDINLIGGSAYNLLIGKVLNTEPFADGTYYKFMEIHSNILVVYPDMSQIMSTMLTRQYASYTLSGTAIIRMSMFEEIKSSIYVASASRLEGSISIRKSSNSHIKGTISIPIDASHDIGSFLIIRK